jgi:hypothetical protein
MADDDPEAEQEVAFSHEVILLQGRLHAPRSRCTGLGCQVDIVILCRSVVVA